MAISGSRVKAQPRLSLSSALCLQLLRERESGRERGRAAVRGVAAELIIRGCKMKTKRNAQIFVVVVVVIVLGKCGRCRCHVEKLQSLQPISTCGTPLCVCVCVCLVPATVSASVASHCLSLFHDCATYPNGFSGLPVLRCSGFVIGRATSCCNNNVDNNNVEACNKCALNHIHKARRPRRETTKTTD